MSVFLIPQMIATLQSHEGMRRSRETAEQACIAQGKSIEEARAICTEAERKFREQLLASYRDYRPAPAQPDHTLGYVGAFLIGAALL